MKSASTATRLWAGRLGKWGWIPNKNRNISLLRSVQSGLGVQSPSYSKDIEGVFLRGELGGNFLLVWKMSCRFASFWLEGPFKYRERSDGTSLHY